MYLLLRNKTRINRCQVCVRCQAFGSLSLSRKPEPLSVGDLVGGSVGGLDSSFCLWIAVFQSKLFGQGGPKTRSSGGISCSSLSMLPAGFG